MSRVSTLHQFVVAASRGDAIYNEAAILQKWLQDRGWESKIYAEHIQTELAGQVWPYSTYQPSNVGEVVILHYSIGSALLQHLLKLDLHFILIYHNLTPPHFMAGLNTSHGQLLQMGLNLLPHFAKRTLLALADSEYNQRDLEQIGFIPTAVLPVPFDQEAYDQLPDPQVLDQFKDDFVNLLFVGRIVPNKRPEDVLKVFYYYQKINPQARLFLVGAPMSTFCPYRAWLEDFIKYLGLTEVYLTGYVSLAQLLAYYQLADVYISMSEHEGYGVPLVESMYFDVPVLAYKATAVPDTLRCSGLQVTCKDYLLIAELVDQLVNHSALRASVIKRQRQRLSEISVVQVKQLFDSYIDQVFAPSS